MPIANILNSQNRKYVNRMSSIILVCAIALARARPFTRKRKNNPAVVGGVLRHLRRWFFLPVEPSTCIYIKWRVVGIFKSNSLSNKHELVQNGRMAGVGRRCEKGESLSTTSEITSSFLFHDPLHPGVLVTPAGALLSLSRFLSRSRFLFLASARSLFLFYLATFQAVTQCGKWENDKKIYPWKLGRLRGDSEVWTNGVAVTI